MAFKIFKISKANAEFDAAEAALAPALAKAGITSISIDGKVTQLTDASLAQKISALIAVQPAVADSQQLSDVLVSNEAIATELEKTKLDLSLAQTSVSSLTRENGSLKTELATSQASVQTLTGEKADLNNRLTAATSQFSANAATIRAQDGVISKLCIDTNVLELTGEDGKPLAADAKDDEKLAAAAKVPFGDKVKAYKGAVNAAIKRTGANPLEIPELPSDQAKNGKRPLTGAARMAAGTRIAGYAR
jgi:septal ring factor EnvC (AmiA/AmiB activator)